VAEVLYGLLILLTRRRPCPFVVSILFMLAATLNIAIYSSAYLTSAFNALTLNALVVALAVIGLLTISHLPTAERCRRTIAEAE
jgi:hypothetical protein